MGDSDANADKAIDGLRESPTTITANGSRREGTAVKAKETGDMSTKCHEKKK